MLNRILAVATLTTVTALSVSGASDAAPVVQQQPPPAQRVDPPKILGLTKMVMKNSAAMVGETRALEATLTGPGGSGLAGKSVNFKLSRDAVQLLVLGNAVTNAQGKATLSWKLPELAPARYMITASFAGDDDNRSANDEAPCAVFKATTEFDVKYTYGALDSHGGPKFGVVLILLRRKSGQDSIAKPIRVTVAGKRQDLTSRVGSAIQIVLPAEKDVYVKMEFDGDAFHDPTMYHDRYQL